METLPFVRIFPTKLKEDQQRSKIVAYLSILCFHWSKDIRMKMHRSNDKCNVRSIEIAYKYAITIVEEEANFVIRVM